MNWTTHDIFNQVSELRDYDLLATDPALSEAIRRDGAEWAMPQLSHYAQLMGQSDAYELAAMANRHTPELQRFDTRGQVPGPIVAASVIAPPHCVHAGRAGPESRPRTG